MKMPQARRSVVVAAVMPVVLAAGLVIAGCDREPSTPAIIAAAADATDARLRITYPLEGTLFPPDSVAPTFVWEDKTGLADRWDVVVRDDTGGDLLGASVDAPRWRPSEESWKQIKRSSVDRNAEVIVAGVSHTKRATVVSPFAMAGNDT